MVWLVEKKIFYHLFDLGFEGVEIPIRVKFEFEVREGALVPDSLSKNVHLYNRSALEKHYPNLDRAKLQRSIEKTVKAGIEDKEEGSGLNIQHLTAMLNVET